MMPKMDRGNVDDATGVNALARGKRARMMSTRPAIYINVEPDAYCSLTHGRRITGEERV